MWAWFGVGGQWVWLGIWIGRYYSNLTIMAFETKKGQGIFLSIKAMLLHSIATLKDIISRDVSFLYAIERDRGKHLFQTFKRKIMLS